MTKTTATLDLLERSSVFSALTAQDKASLAVEMRDVHLARGQLLFSRGDPSQQVYLVVHGRVRFSVLTAEGREISFSHAVAGDVFGEIAALEDVPRSADATAIVRTHLKVVEYSTFRRLLSANSDFAFSIIKLLCGRLRSLSNHYEAVGLLPVEVRVARLLFEMLSEAERAEQDGRRTLPFDLPQNELGLLVGTTRQRMNAALTTLERAGAITRPNPAQVTCDVDKLKKMAQLD